WPEFKRIVLKPLTMWLSSSCNFHVLPLSKLAAIVSFPKTQSLSPCAYMCIKISRLEIPFSLWMDRPPSVVLRKTPLPPVPCPTNQPCCESVKRNCVIKFEEAVTTDRFDQLLPPSCVAYNIVRITWALFSASTSAQPRRASRKNTR